ncbi:hypothetical protein BS78_K181300 [Paspalum vaginatum]|uniref:Reverse transcriptase zinc-binding domain-containing protein n=1 Tax=Paspalum vaginatum TaxID=158149 RepID=A0A9W7XAM9_9POAL|nr:hypothetical protein BS78_K181300 [Paspalum vaginatum]
MLTFVLRGEAVFINSCLTSIPMYMMGCYHLYEGAHNEMDSIRSRFFWQGVGNKKKYHMVKWEHLARPKDFGGLGFLDTRTMNRAMLVKWLVRLDSEEANICLNLLRRKYMGEKGVLQQKSRGGASQFWQSLWEAKDWYEKVLGWKCESGIRVRFWDDVWLDECPLRVSYPNVYKICDDKNISVADAHSRGWNLSFRRRMTEIDLSEWREMVDNLMEVEISGGQG